MLLRGVKGVLNVAALGSLFTEAPKKAIEPAYKSQPRKQVLLIS
jgi:hypothetical protein